MKHLQDFESYWHLTTLCWQTISATLSNTNGTLMGYVRFYHVKCDSCGATHNLAVENPTRGNQDYGFVCPGTGETVALSGLPLEAAKTIVYSIPEDCIEAKPIRP